MFDWVLNVPLEHPPIFMSGRNKTVKIKIRLLIYYHFIKLSQIQFGYYDILKILFSHLLRFPAAAIPMPRRTAAPTVSKTPPKATDPLPPESVEKSHSKTSN